VISAPATATIAQPRGRSARSCDQPRVTLITATMRTAVHMIRWASTSTGAAGSSSGQNAGNRPQIEYAPMAAATPRRSSSVPTSPSEHRPPRRRTGYDERYRAYRWEAAAMPATISTSVSSRGP